MKIANSSVAATPRPASTYNQILLIATTTVVSLLIGLSWYIFYFQKKAYITPSNTPAPTQAAQKPEEKKVNAKVYSDSEANYWEVIDTSKSPHFPTGVKFFEQNGSPTNTAVRWKNFLLGVNVEHYVEKSGGAYLGSPYSQHYTLQAYIRTIRVYNIDTGEAFDISLEKPTWGEIWYVTSQVVDNTYYFGVGGAFGPSLGYKLDLPPLRSSRIVKLSEEIGSEITKYEEVYVSSFCYEGCNYSLFNPATLKTTPLERMNEADNGYDSSRKEELIGIDSKARMIINIRDSKSYRENDRAPYDTEMLAAVPLGNETLTTPLLKAEELPEKISYYFMIEGIDKVVMLGRENIYLYDIIQDKVRAMTASYSIKQYLSSIYKSADYVPHSVKDKLICFSAESTTKFAIDVVLEVIAETEMDSCKRISEEEQKQLVFKNLNLPENFEFVYTPTSYKTYNILKNVPESEVPTGAKIMK